MSIDDNSFKEFQKSIGERVKYLRVLRGLSQLDLAVNCGYEKTTISRIENGRANITLKTILKLSNGLEIEPHLLLKT